MRLLSRPVLYRQPVSRMAARRATIRPIDARDRASLRLPATSTVVDQVRANAQASSAARRDSSAARILADDPCLDQLLLEWYGNENGDAIVIISHAGTIAHANDRFRGLWQVDPEARLNVEADVWNAVL